MLQTKIIHIIFYSGDEPASFKAHGVSTLLLNPLAIRPAELDLRAASELLNSAFTIKGVLGSIGATSEVAASAETAKSISIVANAASNMGANSESLRSAKLVLAASSETSIIVLARRDAFFAANGDCDLEALSSATKQAYAALATNAEVNSKSDAQRAGKTTLHAQSNVTARSNAFKSLKNEMTSSSDVESLTIAIRGAMAQLDASLVQMESLIATVRSISTVASSEAEVLAEVSMIRELIATVQSQSEIMINPILLRTAGASMDQSAGFIEAEDFVLRQLHGEFDSVLAQANGILETTRNLTVEIEGNAAAKFQAGLDRFVQATIDSHSDVESIVAVLKLVAAKITATTGNIRNLADSLRAVFANLAVEGNATANPQVQRDVQNRFDGSSDMYAELEISKSVVALLTANGAVKTISAAIRNAHASIGYIAAGSSIEAAALTLRTISLTFTARGDISSEISMIKETASILIGQSIIDAAVGSFRFGNASIEASASISAATENGKNTNASVSAGTELKICIEALRAAATGLVSTSSAEFSANSLRAATAILNGTVSLANEPITLREATSNLLAGLSGSTLVSNTRAAHAELQTQSNLSGLPESEKSASISTAGRTEIVATMSASQVATADFYFESTVTVAVNAVRAADIALASAASFLESRADSLRNVLFAASGLTDLQSSLSIERSMESNLASNSSIVAVTGRIATVEAASEFIANLFALADSLRNAATEMQAKATIVGFAESSKSIDANLLGSSELISTSNTTKSTFIEVGSAGSSNAISSRSASASSSLDAGGGSLEFLSSGLKESFTQVAGRSGILQQGSAIRDSKSVFFSQPVIENQTAIERNNHALLGPSVSLLEGISDKLSDAEIILNSNSSIMSVVDSVRNCNISKIITASIDARPRIVNEMTRFGDDETDAAAGPYSNWNFSGALELAHNIMDVEQRANAGTTANSFLSNQLLKNANVNALLVASNGIMQAIQENSRSIFALASGGSNSDSRIVIEKNCNASLSGIISIDNRPRIVNEMTRFGDDETDAVTGPYSNWNFSGISEFAPNVME